MHHAHIIFLGAFLLAGERLHFDGALQPQFTENQTRNTAEATRVGLARWAATEHGRMLIEHFNVNEYQVTIIEDTSENGIGRAPQPGLATLVAASDHAKLNRTSSFSTRRTSRSPMVWSRYQTSQSRPPT